MTNIKKILVTGARAPAALEIIRQLAHSGYVVYAADCLHFPLGRFSRFTTKYCQHPSPRHNPKEYIVSLLAFVQSNQIDLIVPTCEEVFYLSADKDILEQHCRVFCADFAIMSQLHNKFIFQDIAHKHQMGSITTHIITTPADTTAVIQNLSPEKTYVVKPAFSRFGDRVSLNLSPDAISARLNQDFFPWVIQEYIKGQEYCAYALCQQGKVIAQVCYQPYLRADSGASIYFQPVLQSEITRQISALVAGLNYSGQISFDFMVRHDHKVFVLECNPRCTSGAHLLPNNLDWHSILLQKNATVSAPIANPSAPDIKPKMLLSAMLIYGKITSKQFWQALKAADDVIFSQADWLPCLGQLIALLEIFCRSLLSKKSLKDTATCDIEWNGQDIALNEFDYDKNNKAI